MKTPQKANEDGMGDGQALLLRQSLPVLRLADELLQGHISVEIFTFPLGWLELIFPWDY